ncbi:sporulation protein YqfC [Thermoflavimicrobium daqui]|nr:sporulation protein YqfC [Thermoflavimicrobium daqui]
MGIFKNVKMRKRLSKWLDLPPDMVEEVPRIEMIGSSFLQIENHRGLLFFSSEKLQFRLDQGKLNINGKKLKIKSMTAEMAWVEGTITDLIYME